MLESNPIVNQILSHGGFTAFLFAKLIDIVIFGIFISFLPRKFAYGLSVAAILIYLSVIYSNTLLLIQ